MKSPGRVRKSKVNYLLELTLLLAIVITLIPIVWTVILAFLPNKSIIDSSFDFSFSLANFRTLLEPTQNFPRQVLNSSMITLGTVFLTLAISAGSGESVSKLKPPESDHKIPTKLSSVTVASSKPSDKPTVSAVNCCTSS